MNYLLKTFHVFIIFSGFIAVFDIYYMLEKINSGSSCKSNVKDKKDEFESENHFIKISFLLEFYEGRKLKSASKFDKLDVWFGSTNTIH